MLFAAFLFLLKLKRIIINCKCTVFLREEMIRIPSWPLLLRSNRKSPSWKVKSPRFDIKFCLQSLLIQAPNLNVTLHWNIKEISLIFFIHSLSKSIFHCFYHYSTKIRVTIIFSHSCQKALYKIKIKSDHPCFKPFDDFATHLEHFPEFLPHPTRPGSRIISQRIV